MRRTLLGVVENVGLPVGSYAVLRALGANDIWALTGSAAIAALVLLTQWIRSRQVSALGSLVLLRFVLSFGLAFVTEDARWLLVKDALITAGIGAAALATLALRQSLIERIRRDLSGDPQDFRRRIACSTAFRRVHRQLTGVWGVSLLGEAGLSLTLSLNLPVPAAFAITNITGPAVILGLITLTELRVRSVCVTTGTGKSPAGRSAGEMMSEKSFRSGDHVEWQSHGNTVHGTVEHKITERTDAGGRTVDASAADPQYLVRSDKSGRTAVHKPSALKHVPKQES